MSYARTTMVHRTSPRSLSSWTVRRDVHGWRCARSARPATQPAPVGPSVRSPPPADAAGKHDHVSASAGLHRHSTADEDAIQTHGRSPRRPGTPVRTAARRPCDPTWNLTRSATIRPLLLRLDGLSRRSSSAAPRCRRRSARRVAGINEATLPRERMCGCRRSRCSCGSGRARPPPRQPQHDRRLGHYTPKDQCPGRSPCSECGPNDLRNRGCDRRRRRLRGDRPDRCNVEYSKRVATQWPVIVDAVVNHTIHACAHLGRSPCPLCL
jgi:hypothetical protein